MKKIIIFGVIAHTTFMTAVMIRQALPNDVHAIARAHCATWQKAYRGVHSQTFYENINEELFTMGWDNHFKNPGPNSFVLVATQDEKIVGFVAGGPIEDHSMLTESHDAELYKLYILPEFQGQGLGKKLMSDCLQRLHELGHTKVLVRAIKENILSCKFYEKEGGIVIEERSCPADDVVHEVFYSFQLATKDKPLPISSL